MGCYNSKIVNAPIGKVWQTIRNFHDMSWAAGVVETCDNVGTAKGDQLGARRKLNGVFVETLQGLNDADHVITYSIDEGPGPLATTTGYVGKVRLFSVTDGDKTFVEWSSTWTDSSGGVKEFCDPVYQGVLAALAKKLA